MASPEYMKYSDPDGHWPIGVDQEGNGPVDLGSSEWVEDVCMTCSESWPCDSYLEENKNG